MTKEIQVKCIKDVIMNDDGNRAFTKGKVYNATQNGVVIKATNDDEYDEHYINDNSLEDTGWFDRHFEIVFAEKEELPEYVKTILEDEKKQLTEWVDDLEKRVEFRRQQLEDAEQDLVKAKSKLEDVEKVLNK